MLERGEADLAIGDFPETVAAPIGPGADAALRCERLHDSDDVVVMRRGHPLADGELTLDAFGAAHHVLVNFSGRAHGLVDRR